MSKITGVYTNTCPVDAYRGAGRPEAAFLLEKLVDACARDLGLGARGNPPAQLHQAGAVPVPHADRPALRRRRVRRPHDAGAWSAPAGRASTSGWRSRRQAGKIRGIGMATYIEACAFPGSEPAFVRAQRRRHGDAEDRHADQRAGPCHRLCAVRRREAQHRHRKDHRPPGRHGRLEDGGGTGGSRSIPLGGVSASRAGEELAEKIKRIAADELEASAADIELHRRHGADRRHRPLDELRGDRQGREKAGRPEGLRRVRPGRSDLPERHAYLRGRDRSGNRRDRRSSATPSSTISA